MTFENLLILFNIFMLESLLSVDNAAVLAIMVKPLPFNERHKALKYGILGAFIFRGVCLLLAGWLIKIIWLKIAGGLYLVSLTYKHFFQSKEEAEAKPTSFFGSLAIQKIGLFWVTVAMVEVMDLAFSIDNIFAAVAMTDNLWLIIVGVCIGIISMRFVSQWFTNLIEKYPSLENSAFIVILILGLKLVLSGILDYTDKFKELKRFMAGEYFELSFSALMILVFVAPIVDKVIHKK